MFSTIEPEYTEGLDLVKLKMPVLEQRTGLSNTIRSCIDDLRCIGTHVTPAQFFFHYRSAWCLEGYESSIGSSEDGDTPVPVEWEDQIVESLDQEDGR